MNTPLHYGSVTHIFKTCGFRSPPIVDVSEAFRATRLSREILRLPGARCSLLETPEALLLRGRDRHFRLRANARAIHSVPVVALFAAPAHGLACCTM